jgi:hypothetical protein
MPAVLLILDAFALSLIQDPDPNFLNIPDYGPNPVPVPN